MMKNNENSQDSQDFKARLAMHIGWMHTTAQHRAWVAEEIVQNMKPSSDPFEHRRAYTHLCNGVHNPHSLSMLHTIK